MVGGPEPETTDAALRDAAAAFGRASRHPWAHLDIAGTMSADSDDSWRS